MLDKLHHLIRELGFERNYCVAYSGGLDSQVLLRLCAELRRRQAFSLRAIHVHHGLSPQADQWAEHCRLTCQELKIPFICDHIDARPPQGESLEAYAREQRYAVLKERLQPGEVLLTAHHQDDQAETFLLQLLRGAGPKGLSAMPRLKNFGSGLLARPLLEIRRAELQAYAKGQGLSWIEDELNQDPHYPRNRLRHELLAQWPSAAKTLARSAELCAETQSLLEEYADSDLAGVRGAHLNALSVKRLLELSPARQRLILRRWFESQGLLMPSAVQLEQMLQSVLKAKEDSQPSVVWGGMELRRYRDELVVIKPALLNYSSYAWNFQVPLDIPGLGHLTAQRGLGQGLRTTLGSVEVRFRQGGEVYRLSNGHHQTLKNFFQEQGLPPWERSRLPLIYAGSELIAIPGYFIVDHFKAAPNEEGWALVWSNFV